METPRGRRNNLLGVPVPRGTPEAEIDITVGLVHDLLAEQHPDLADHRLELAGHGWDNVIVRIGPDLVTRLPRRQVAADLILHEQRWLPQLAAGLPLPVAAPIRVGHPGHGYPWAWSICPWFDGNLAADVRLADSALEATRLGTFLHALHRAAPADAPRNPFRGQPIEELIPRIRNNLACLDVEREPIEGLIDHLAGVPAWSKPPVWVHGDLHSANLVVAGGEIAAVLDFGDLTAGDPAVDLAVAWMLFDADARRRFRLAAIHVSTDDATWDRARLWGLHFALVYLRHSSSGMRLARMGRRLLREVTGHDAAR